MCVKQMAPSWRKPQPSDFQGICVPSPQSKSVRVEPLRSKTQESQRPGRGIMPQVPSVQISSIKAVSFGLVECKGRGRAQVLSEGEDKASPNRRQVKPTPPGASKRREVLGRWERPAMERPAA